MTGFKGLTLLDSRTFAMPSDWALGLEKKRENVDVGDGFSGISVYTSDAARTTGSSRYCKLFTSPV